MEPQFWLNKWDKQETGFHLPSAHPWLQKYYTRVFNDSGVFVPLCGKSADLSYFDNNKHYTLGCELSLKAAEQFFVASQIEYDISPAHSFKSLRGSNIELLVGDYFDLQVEQLANCQQVYDRAALIALPGKMRIKYVQHMQKLLPVARMLLITLEYDQQAMSGPPFSVSSNEVQSLFSFADVELLERSEILENEEKFRARGLNYLYECAYLIHW